MIPDLVRPDLIIIKSILLIQQWLADNSASVNQALMGQTPLDATALRSASVALEQAGILPALHELLLNHTNSEFQVIDVSVCDYISFNNPTQARKTVANKDTIEELYNTKVSHRNINKQSDLHEALLSYSLDEIGLYSVSQMAFKHFGNTLLNDIM